MMLSHWSADQIRSFAYANGMGATIPALVEATGRSVAEVRAIILFPTRQGASKTQPKGTPQ